MKTILVDAVHTFVNKNGEVDSKIHEILEQFGNPKIIVTNAPRERIEEFGLDRVPYPVFSLEKNPSKTEIDYWEKLFNERKLNAGNVVYFEHNKKVVETAETLGIPTHHFEHEKKDYIGLEIFLKDMLSEETNLQKWDIYEITTKESVIKGVMFRGRIRNTVSQTTWRC